MKKTMRIILASLLAFMLVGCQPNQPKVDYRYKELENGELNEDFQKVNEITGKVKSKIKMSLENWYEVFNNGY